MPYIKLLIKQMIPFTLKLGMVFMALVLLAWIGGSILFTSASNNLIARSQQTMSVTGSAKKKVTPDSVQITLGKIFRGSAPAELQDKAGTAVNALVAKLKEVGVADEQIRTGNYSVNPIYDSSNNLKEYEVNVSVVITLEKQNPKQELLSKIIQAGTSSGVDVVNGLYFYLSDYDQQVKDLQTAAIADATLNARKQADAAGTSLGKVINVGSGYYPYYSSGNTAAPVASDMGGSKTETSTPVTINPGQFDLSASVTVTYELN